jgi:hypothetical protein
MSRKPRPRKQKINLALQWIDEQFDVPIQTLPLAAFPPVHAARSVVMLETALPLSRRTFAKR